MRCLGITLATALAALVLVANAQPAPTSSTSDVAVPSHMPAWNGVYAKQFPGCVASGSFLPARIVVVSREGEARTMRYNDATVARIKATWETADAWDDLYTVGKCAR